MLAAGLMSGTSMDGIDAALLQTDGTAGLIRPVAYTTLSYSAEFRRKLKSAELAVSMGEIPDPKIIAESTELHRQALEQLLQISDTKPEQIGVVGYHGQTLLHRPAEGRSVIIGDGAKLAKDLGICVVNDFRGNDLAHGGQGAPLAPLYHHALTVRDHLWPAAVVNCGGIANITFIPSDDPAKMLAFDTGPGNALIDRLVRLRTDTREFMDKDGQYGRNGSANREALDTLWREAVISRGNRKKNYLQLPPPKSLDTHDMVLPSCIDSLSIEDACRTLEEFTAQTIAASLHFLDGPPPKRWILAGGGWHNPVITDTLQGLLPDCQFQTASDCGWNTQMLEAELFAWLAVRSLKNLPLSLPGTTGVPVPLSGGKLYTYTQIQEKQHVKKSYSPIANP